MVVKMMRWPPWPPLFWSKKFEVVVSFRRIEGLDFEGEEEERVIVVEVQWKGQKGMALGSLRRSTKKNLTKECSVSDSGVVELDEEFRTVCNFSGPKEGAFYPWELAFTVFNGVNQGLKNRAAVFGTASLNLADYASATEGKDSKEFGLKVTLNVPGCTSESSPSLTLSLMILELGTAQELSGTVQGSTSPLPLSPRSLEAFSTARDEFSALKAGLRKVKTFKEYVSAGRGKKKRRDEDGSDGRSSIRSEDTASHYPFDTDSLDDDTGGDSEKSKEDFGIKQSVSYETLALANCAQGSFYSNTNVNGDDECLIYYSNRKPDIGCSCMENSSTPVSEQILQPSSKRRILPWKKRKMNSKSPKAKGEPLLKKHYGEEGGDDIDFDRRQLSSSDESSLGWHKTEDGSTTNRSSVSEFGDDSFAVGSWESKEVASRDGLMKLQTQVFFASIDQRSERAAGESACTALVAVIADWLQSNQDEMPIKSEFDSLIRDGSLEWRNLCENKDYIERFPDKHFDLETVLQAKVRPLSVVPEKSFIGFFHPEGLQEGELDFLHGVMSFDSMWDEISRLASDLPCNDESSMVYVVSWNDHFFVLKVKHDTYYIIDTLGERLFEGCNQAYVLKFDKDTTIQRLPKEKKPSDDKPGSHKGQPKTFKEVKAEVKPLESSNKPRIDGEEEVVCKGKESCKEFIKSFLAAIPLRELQADLKKGLMASTPIHNRLQIEFHYTKLHQPIAEYPTHEVAAEAPAMPMSVAVG
ncbi:EEIG1/EHBP1 N-terminal domain containing protein [Trema orientale]|uniref:EEIG1/EHBP1 N-terminal domain containing protein n=1 Tax=Trema orientale TaxID=63057 RepID=A0A2P5EAN1_TREOI|nr:EEIG1/EHBP1 N-terminal domain containing protein [Trema orientale]